jgi:hypothetical protein
MKRQRFSRSVISFLMFTALLLGMTGMTNAATSQTILYYEDFTSNVYDLSGWVPVDVQGYEGEWYCGGQSVNFSSSRADGLQTRLEQPNYIELPADANDLKLTFDMYHYLNNGKTDRLQVQIFTENGGTWSNLENALFYRDLTYCQNYTSTEGWYTHTISLDSYKGQKIQIGFLGISSATDGDPYHIFIDEVYITSEAAASTDANLSGITLSSGPLEQSFSPTTISYTASVPYSVSSITVTPTVNQSDATVKVNGVPVTSGTASGAINLNAGSNVITAVVTAQDGTTTRTYTVNVTRAAASTDAALSGLRLSSGTLSPRFVPGRTSYTASVANSVASITVRPTVNQRNATVTVNGVDVVSGRASGKINLNVGSNVITVVVTAQDGTTTRTYKITVMKTIK